MGNLAFKDLSQERAIKCCPVQSVSLNT